jgi:hypothetical protein
MSGSLFGPTSPKGGGGGGGGGAALVTQDEGVLVDANTALLNFTGTGVTATPIAPGQVRIDVPGIGAGLWAGHVPVGNFVPLFPGGPLTGAVVFPLAHPDGLAYSVGVDELVVLGSGLSLGLSVENKTALGFDIVLNTIGPVPNLIGVDWQVQGSTTVIPGVWAGAEPAVAFVGAPLTAPVVFGAPHPSGVNYAVAADELVVALSGLSLDISVENKTPNGFDLVLNIVGPVPPTLIQVDWQVQPYGITPGPPGSNPSLPGIQNIYMVDQGTNAVQDGSQQFPFHSVNAAVVAAVAPAVVKVYPGTYVEQLVAKSGIKVRGVDASQCILENTGATPATQPLADAPADSYDIEELTVRTSVVNNVIGRFGGTTVPKVIHNFRRVIFDNGHFEEIGGLNSTGANFYDCEFTTTGFSLTGAHTAVVALFAYGCHFAGTPTLTSSHSGGSRLWLADGCRFSTIGAFDIGGDWDFRAFDSQICWGQRFTHATDVEFQLQGCEIQGGIDFTGVPSPIEITSCTYLNSLGGGPDITSLNVIPGVIYENNTQDHGIPGELHITSDYRRIGARLDGYYAVQDAFDAVDRDDITISVERDSSVPVGIALPPFKVKVHGQGRHTLAGPILGRTITDVQDNEEVTFEDIILEGEIVVSGRAAVMRFSDDVSLHGRINLMSGDSATLISVHDSDLTGWGGVADQAIRIAAADPRIVVDHCKVAGISAGANPYAILWDNGVTNNNLKLKYSSVAHGTNPAANPFGRDVAQTPNYRSHHCAYNSDPELGGIWTNLIAPAQRFDALDPNAVF